MLCDQLMGPQEPCTYCPRKSHLLSQEAADSVCERLLWEMFLGMVNYPTAVYLQLLL